MSRLVRKVWEWYKECWIVGLHSASPRGRKYRVKNLVRKGYTEVEAWETVFLRDISRGCQNWSEEEKQRAGTLANRRIEEEVRIRRFLLGEDMEVGCDEEDRE